MTDMELDYQERAACQGRWHIACLENESCFRHLGEGRSFNPSVLRADRIRKMESHPVVGPIFRLIWTIARHVRALLRASGA